MAKMKTLTLNGETYTVDDPDSVSYEEEQNLSDEEKAKARGNIAAASVEDLEAFRKVAASSAIVCEASGEVIAVSDASDWQLQGLTLYGKTTQDGTPTPKNPIELVSVGNGGSVGVTVCGKNLYKGDYYGGKILTAIPDTVTFNGSANAVYVLYVEIKQGVTYTITTYKSATSTTKSRIGFSDIHPTSIVRGKTPCYGYQELSAGANTATVTAPIDGWMVVLAYSVYDNIPIETQRNMFQVEVDTNSTAYEPYIQPQTLTVLTPNGLHGVPVSSGGNYTDESGQAWICDEVDFARGVYVQRVEKTPMIGETWWWDYQPVSNGYRLRGRLGSRYNLTNNAVLCDSLATVSTWYYEGISASENLLYVNTQSFGSPPVIDDWYAYLEGNPITCLLALTEPIETPLSAEELEQYAALHTNKPNTTIFNDSGAGMKVEYVADTKAYIDNKFSELAAVIVNNV